MILSDTALEDESPPVSDAGDSLPASPPHARGSVDVRPRVPAQQDVEDDTEGIEDGADFDGAARRATAVYIGNPTGTVPYGVAREEAVPRDHQDADNDHRRHPASLYDMQGPTAIALLPRSVVPVDSSPSLSSASLKSHLEAHQGLLTTMTQKHPLLLSTYESQLPSPAHHLAPLQVYDVCQSLDRQCSAVDELRRKRPDTEALIAAAREQTRRTYQPRLERISHKRGQLDVTEKRIEAAEENIESLKQQLHALRIEAAEAVKENASVRKLRRSTSPFHDPDVYTRRLLMLIVVVTLPVVAFIMTIFYPVLGRSAVAPAV
ncbi:hypothetical protein HKX48_009591 [Thoreauomyces humboldtii]|nr:hypothetical protein HKX48_009591 [Thoreauomyces humboldtii]